MEDTLRDITLEYYNEVLNGLNPCFNGRYSQSEYKKQRTSSPIYVLILVLMEDTLREQNLRILEFRGFDNSKTCKTGFC